MRKAMRIYLILTLVGVILVGLGCGISVFEMSTYQTADYSAADADTSLPAIEMSTKTLEAPLSGSSQFKLDYYRWNDSKYEVEIDNSLQDKVLIQVSGPKDLYNYYLNQEGTNYYNLYFESRPFESFHFFLKTAKEGYFVSNPPPIQVTLRMNEAQAKNFKLNEERDRVNEISTDYQERISSIEEQYQETLTSLEEEQQVQQQELQDSYEAQLDELRQQYEEALAQKDAELENQQQQYEEKITSLQQQIETIRDSLN